MSSCITAKKSWTGMTARWSCPTQSVYGHPPHSQQGVVDNQQCTPLHKFHSQCCTTLTALCWIIWCAAPSHDPFRLLASPVHIAVGGLSLADATTISTEHVTRYVTYSRVHPVLSYHIFSHSTLSYPILSHYVYIKEDCYSSYRYFSISSNTLIPYLIILYSTFKGG
jgi:hypothetical protein